MPRSDVCAAVRVRAFAKINLTLRVVGARPGGYHELRTTFQSLALHDTLTCRARPGPFHIVCGDEACPADETNLVWHAAEHMWANAGRRGTLRDVAVRITKRIPIAAGLGGGSSDAAAAIRALAALWRLGLTPARTRKIAAAIGADVPFFLEGGTALGVERGDVLRPLVDAPAAWVTLVVPAFGVSTAHAYRWFDVSVARPVAQPVARPFQVRDLRGAESPALRAERQNDLEAPVAARHPEIARLVKALGRAGASHAAMSGSGSAVFGLFDRRADASAAARALARRGRRVIVTRTLDRAGYARLARPTRVRSG
jgi:4-diphosphocytidyl-2-C-methyl-D-erythritol kinase